MITCRELINEFLADYLGDGLPPDARREFDEHLAVCPACVNYLESYKRTIRLEKEAFAEEQRDPPPIPEELIRAVLAAKDKRGTGPGT